MESMSKTIEEKRNGFQLKTKLNGVLYIELVGTDVHCSETFLSGLLLRVASDMLVRMSRNILFFFGFIAASSYAAPDHDIVWFGLK